MTSLLSWCAERFCLVANTTLNAANDDQQPKPKIPRAKSRRRAHQMDSVAEKWLHSTAYHHYWRVDPSLNIDDLIQDGHVKWTQVVRRYPDIVEPKHLMALFKTAYMRHLHDLSNRKTKLTGTVEELKRATIEEAMEGVAECHFAVEEAPPAVRRVLEAIQTDEGLAALRLHKDGPGLIHQTCEHFGVEPPVALWSPRELATAVARNWDDWLGLFTFELSQAARMLPYSAHKPAAFRLIKARIKSSRGHDQHQHHAKIPVFVGALVAGGPGDA
jgi:hypothetical protein